MTTMAVAVDCGDPQRLADFWSDLLGWKRAGGVAQYVAISGSGHGSVAGPKLIFQAVPEAKRGKNRLHLDIDLDPGLPLEPEVARARELGATLVVDEPVEEFGMRWQVLADPEGNEFCIVARPAD